MRRARGRIQLDDFGTLLEGLIISTRINKNIAQHCMDNAREGIQTNGALKFGVGLFVTIRYTQIPAEQLVCEGVSRVEFNSTLKFRFRSQEIVVIHGGKSERDVGFARTMIHL